MVLRLTIYLIVRNLVHRYHSAENDLKKRRDKYQPISIIFEIESQRLAKGKFRKLAFKSKTKVAAFLLKSPLSARPMNL